MHKTMNCLFLSPVGQIWTFFVVGFHFNLENSQVYIKTIGKNGSEMVTEQRLCALHYAVSFFRYYYFYDSQRSHISLL